MVHLRPSRQVDACVRLHLCRKHYRGFKVYHESFSKFSRIVNKQDSCFQESSKRCFLKGPHRPLIKGFEQWVTSNQGTGQIVRKECASWFAYLHCCFKSCRICSRIVEGKSPPTPSESDEDEGEEESESSESTDSPCLQSEDDEDDEAFGASHTDPSEDEDEEKPRKRNSRKEVGCACGALGCCFSSCSVYFSSESDSFCSGSDSDE